MLHNLDGVQKEEVKVLQEAGPEKIMPDLLLVMSMEEKLLDGQSMKNAENSRLLAKHGGRIGLYEGGDAEDYPENESENIFEFMRDQDIPISEEVEGGPTEEQIAMVMAPGLTGKGMDMETISETGKILN